MKNFFKLKTWLITFLMFVSAVAASAVIVSVQFKYDIKKVLAGVDDNVFGWAWSSNFGWVSFNCTNIVNQGINEKYSGGTYTASSFAQQTSDGGYFLAGYFKNSPFISADHTILLIKTNEKGEEMWRNTFGQVTVINKAYSAQQTADGGYIILGSAGSDTWLIKVHSDGSPDWEKYFSGPLGSSVGSSIKQTSDNGYIISGHTRPPGGATADWDAWLVKTNSVGDIIWQRTYGQAGIADMLYSVQETSDGGYIAAGRSQNPQATWLLKTNSIGDPDWNYYSTAVSQGTYESVIEVSDGYVAVGRRFILTKVDLSGNMVWEKDGNDLFLPAHVDGTTVYENADGSFIIRGNQIIGAPRYLILIKADSNGERLWHKTRNEEINDTARSFLPTSNGSYITTTTAASASNTDAWLVEFDQNGDLMPGSGTCGSIDYGVNIDEVSGNFIGHAWSPNIGWIDFNPSGSYPGGPDHSVRVDFNDKSVTGWAQILALGGDGWLKMDNVSIDATSGDFTGWAWNGNIDGSVGLGWLSFNSTNPNAGGGAYKVFTTADLDQVSLVIDDVVPALGAECSSLGVEFSYSDANSIIYLKVYRDDVEINSDYTGFISGRYTDSAGLTSGQIYKYKLEAYDAADSLLATSNEMFGTTLSFCAPSGVTAVGQCPNWVNLSWADGIGADSYKIARCNQTESADNCFSDAGFDEITSGSCSSPIINSCTDNTIATAKAANTYIYKVTSVSLSEGDGDSAYSNPVVPCNSRPSWEEVKPR